MLRNIIGPVFNFSKCVFWLLFFINPLLSAGRMRFLKIKKEERKKKNLDQFLTYKKANLGPVFNFTASYYIYRISSMNRLFSPSRKGGGQNVMRNDGPDTRKRAEYGFKEYGFKHQYSRNSIPPVS